MKRRLPEFDTAQVNGTVYIPKPDVRQFTAAEIDKLAEIVYMRFHHFPGYPVWKDLLCERTRQGITNMVSQVVDAMYINKVLQ